MCTLLDVQLIYYLMSLYCFLQAVTDELGFQYEDMEQRRALEEYGCKLYCELPPQEREATLKQKISELQIEIDRINELVGDFEAGQATDEMTRCEDKLQPLKLLMMQHMFALNQCNSSEKE